MTRQFGSEAVVSLRQFLRLLLSSAGWGRLAGALAVVLVAGMTDGIGLALLVPLLESLDPQAPRSALTSTIARAMELVGLPMTLTSLLMVFLFLVGLRSLLLRAQDILLAQTRQMFVSVLRVRLYRAIAQASWGYIATRRFSDLNAALLGEVDRIGQGTFFALRLPARTLSLLVYLFVAFALAPTFFLLAVALGGLLVVVMRRGLRDSLHLGSSLAQGSRKLHGDVAEFLATVKVAKAHGVEGHHVRDFSRRVSDIARQMLSFSRTQADARLLQDVIGAGAIVAFLWTGLNVGHLPLPQLLPLALIFYRLLPLAKELQQAAQQLLFMLPSFVLVTDTCLQCEAEAESMVARSAVPVTFHRNILIDDVWFSFNGDREPYILRGAYLSLPAGSLTVLSGPSGSGKSTSLDLLTGLLRPVRGEILVDGVPLSALPLQAWRHAIAYVPQDPALFHGTVRANLLWGLEDADDEKVHLALMLAAAEFVYALPAGLDTLVGERGLLLSGGERQRLALARALLRSPKLLLMDEPTSALDAPTERLVVDAICGLRGRLTVVVVTHRPAAFAACDQSVMLAEGTFAPAASV